MVFKIHTDRDWFEEGETLIADANGVFLYIWAKNKNTYLVEKLSDYKVIRFFQDALWDVYRYLYNKNIWFLI